ncbi:MAG: hypothetical protein HOP19_23105 [Acidobacteria bacterium]|nr:hypothetical protein [Acidobacteriota bacterium]
MDELIKPLKAQLTSDSNEQAKQKPVIGRNPQGSPNETIPNPEVEPTWARRWASPELTNQPTDIAPAQKPQIQLLDPSTKTLKTFPPKEGDILSPPNGIEITSAPRASVPETQITFVHRQMQREMYLCLVRENRPSRRVQTEVDGIDILVASGKKATLIEIKTDKNVIAAIREAIGQLLEYSYFCRHSLKSDEIEFLIVTPNPMLPAAQKYLNYLGLVLRIQIKYRQYVPGSYDFTLPD